MKRFVKLSLLIIVGFVLISPSLACIRSTYDQDELYNNSYEYIHINPEKNEMQVTISDIFLIKKGTHRHENITSNHIFYLNSLQVFTTTIDEIYNYSCSGYINKSLWKTIPCKLENNQLIINTTLNQHEWFLDSERYALRLNVIYLVKNIGSTYSIEEEKPFTPESYVTRLKFCEKMPLQMTYIIIDKKYTPSYISEGCNLQYSEPHDNWHIDCENVKLVTLVLKKPFATWHNVVFWAFFGAIFGCILGILIDEFLMKRYKIKLLNCLKNT